ncbi:MAG: cytochrome c biogenesis protein [Methylacidiphilales bacterium]|nr:cytochrome c biogenesis protein [Candidatus Methylacidiphilales bacterium]
MHDRLWLFLATLGYLASAGWGLYALGSQRPIANRFTFLLIAGAFVFHTLFLYQRGQAIGHCPITNLFETLAFFSWSLVLTYLVVGPAYRMSILGAFTAPIVFLVNFFALAAPIDLHVVMPPLGWQLELHATLALLGLGVLGIAALAGMAYLIQEHQLKSHAITSWFYSLPNVGRLEHVQQRILIWGFVIFSAGALLGFFIPHQSAQDWVKIAWSAVVWSLYAVLIVVLGLGRLSHKKIALCSVAGYVFILLTFWGINSLSEAHVFPHEG